MLNGEIYHEPLICFFFLRLTVQTKPVILKLTAAKVQGRVPPSGWRESTMFGCKQS